MSIIMTICVFECVLLDILVSHLREMHGNGQWPPVISYSDKLSPNNCVFLLSFQTFLITVKWTGAYWKFATTESDSCGVNCTNRFDCIIKQCH